MEAGSTSTMGAPTAEVGRMARPTVTGSVPGPRVKENMLVRGTLVSKSLESTHGPAEVTTRVIGRMANVMVWVSNVEESGFTEGNGHKVLKVAMVFASRQCRVQNTRELGQTDSKTDTDLKRTPMEVHIKVSGYGG